MALSIVPPMPGPHFEAIQVDGGLVTVTLDRPDGKDALDGTMVRELVEVLSDVAADGAVRVLVLAGAGDAFCSGRRPGRRRSSRHRRAGPDPGLAGSLSEVQADPGGWVSRCRWAPATWGRSASPALMWAVRAAVRWSSSTP